MNIQPMCLVCLLEQSLRVCNTVGANEEQTKKVLQETCKILSKAQFDQTPPALAAKIYPKISEILSKEDLYFEKKIESVNLAFGLLKKALDILKNSDNPVVDALKIAAIGNVIDFATQKSFGLAEEFEAVFSKRFAIDEREEFKEKLKKAKNVVVIGDNTGEHIFDKLMMETFWDFNDNLNLFYFVRGKPIINDVATEEAKSIDIDKVATIIDSGVDTPGFVYEKASLEAKEIFDKSDLILSKGMGNFECMEGRNDERVYFLFKIKCLAVAERAGKRVGELICVCDKNIKQKEV
jgi:uncharacterized protein with ATP-grasp and redox domains